MPQVWRNAASAALEGRPIEGFGPPANSIATTAPDAPPKYKPVLELVGKDKVAITFPYNPNIIARIKTVDGRVWSDTHKRWEIPTVKLPALIDAMGGKANVQASAAVQAKYEGEVARRIDLDEIRVKSDSDIQIPTLINLYPYQKTAVEFINRAGGRAMDADSMGLGKSATAIGYAMYKKRKTLIVCPKSVKLNWKREIDRFAGKAVCIWESTGKQGRINAQFHIINYDIVDKFAAQLNKLGFELLVCDEATYLKNRNTKRAKAVLGNAKEKKVYPGLSTPDVIFLTGTPILNRPVEAFTLLNFLDPKRFTSLYHFTQSYGGWKGEEPRNLDELHNRTKDLVIRRLKSEVMTELPEKQRNDLIIEMTPSDRHQYETMLSRVFSQWNAGGKPSVSQMPAIQQFLAEKKMPRLIEVVDEILEADRSVLIFSCFIEPLRRLKEHYGKEAGMIDGSLSTAARQVVIDDLAAKRSRIGLFGLKSGGMGIDGLQNHIDTVIFLDQDWVPANHEQAEDRAHRNGQKNKVQVFYMICEDTVDAYMREVLTEKQKIIDTVVDGKMVSLARTKSIFKEVVKRMSKAHSAAQSIALDEITED